MFFELNISSFRRFCESGSITRDLRTRSRTEIMRQSSEAYKSNLLFSGVKYALVISINFSRRYAQKGFLLFRSFSPQMCSPSYSCPCYISTQFEVSMALGFRVNRRHGTDGQTDRQTDGMQHLMQPPRRSHRLAGVAERSAGVLLAAAMLQAYYIAG